MPKSSRASTASPPPADDDDGQSQLPRKRQRVRLSCLECRRRKLSCDRGFPCDRCVRSGTPERCSYETKAGSVVNASSGVPPAFAQLDTRRSRDTSTPSKDTDLSVLRDTAKDHERIRRLELEVAQLKTQLTRQTVSLDGSTVGTAQSPHVQKDYEDQSEQRAALSQEQDALEYQDWGGGAKAELRFFRGKEFRTRYYGPHNASMAFVEVFPAFYLFVIYYYYFYFFIFFY
jgi:hypothetical protein